MTTRREETHEEHRVSGTHVGEPVAHKERKEKGLLEKIFGVRCYTVSFDGMHVTRARAARRKKSRASIRCARARYAPPRQHRLLTP